MCLAGLELAWFPLRRPEFLAYQGTAATSTLMIATALAGCGLHSVCRPHRATTGGITAILLALLSFPLANLGGFLTGMLLALAGGALAVGHRTGGTPPHAPRRPSSPVPEREEHP